MTGERVPVLLLAVLPPLLALGLHLPWIDSAFGPGCNNAGSYLSVFARAWERHGFLELRGLPIHSFGLEPTTEGEVYLNHPPLPFWLAGWSSDEWVARLPATVGHLLLCGLTALLAARLLASRLGGLLAGCAVATNPCLAFWVHCSFEPLVMVCGLGSLALAPRAVLPGAWSARLAICAIAFVGVWCDWSMAFFLCGLVCWWPGDRERLRAASWMLGSVFLASVAAIGTVVAWARWAQAGPLAPRLDGFVPFLDRAEETLGFPEDWGLWFEAVGGRYLEGHGAVVIGVGLLGCLVFIRRAPRLFLALLVASALQVLVPADHALDILHFTSFAAIPLALGVGALGARAGGVGWGGILLALVVLGAGTLDTVRSKEAGADTIFADLGWSIDEAATRYAEDGSLAQAYVVHSSLFYAYMRYIESPYVGFGPDTPAGLDTLLPWQEVAGLRLLVMEWETSGEGAAARFLPSPTALVARLEAEGYPAYRVPRLERTVRIPDGDFDVRIRRARVFTLSEGTAGAVPGERPR